MNSPTLYLLYAHIAQGRKSPMNNNYIRISVHTCNCKFMASTTDYLILLPLRLPGLDIGVLSPLFDLVKFNSEVNIVLQNCTVDVM